MRPFKHYNAVSLADAISAANKKSKILAGGTDCLSLLKNKLLPAYPEVLVNIKTIAGLEYIEEDAYGLRIGALTRLCDIEDSPIIKDKHSILAEATRSVSSPQIRNMATIGGNLCQDTRCWYYRCSPLTGRDYFCYRKGGCECFAVKGDNRYHAIMGGRRCYAVCPSDIAIALTALEANIVIQGKAGERIIPVRDFFKTMGIALSSHEIVKEVRIPRSPEVAKQTFLKFRLRKALDFAIVSVATIITMKDGICEEARIALGAIAPAPVRATIAEKALIGNAINPPSAEATAMLAVADAKPLSMNAYKVEITKALVKRALLS